MSKLIRNRLVVESVEKGWKKGIKEGVELIVEAERICNLVYLNLNDAEEKAAVISCIVFIKAFEWRDRAQHVLFFMAYLLDWGLLNFILYETHSLNPKHVPSIVHYLAVIIIVGSPMLLFQTFIGDYSGRGCIFMGEMLPVAYGLGYAMLWLSYVRFTYSLFYTLKTLEYLIVALFTINQPWMICTKKHYSMYPQCFQKKDIEMCPTRANSDSPCFKPHSKILSALIYQRCNIFLRCGTDEWIVKEGKVLKPLFHILILFPVILIYLFRSIRSFAVSMRASILLSFGVFLSILVVASTRSGAITGVYKMFFHFNAESLWDIGTWETTLRRVILALRLAEGGHILFGSYISSSAPDFRRSLYLTLAFVFLVTATILYYFFILGILDFNLGMGVQDLELDEEESTIFVTFPLVLGLKASPYLFSVLYFLVLFLLNFHALVLNAFAIERTITNHFNIYQYMTYIKVCVIVLGIILTFLLEVLSYHNILQVIECEFKQLHTCTIALQIFVLLMYGLQRISDDMIFHGYPTLMRFTKFCWITTLVVCTSSFYAQMKDRPASNVKFTARLVASGTFCLPFVIFFFVKTFSYIRKKDIIGLLKPSDLYGPIDLEKRILRILYNPRLATRSKRRDEICYHRCINDSNLLQVAVQDEIDQIKKVLSDLHTSSVDLTLNGQIITQLKENEKILLKGLPRGEPT